MEISPEQKLAFVQKVATDVQRMAAEGEDIPQAAIDGVIQAVTELESQL